MKSVLRAFSVLALAAGGVAGWGLPAQAAADSTVHVVLPGQSIQAAVDAASPGDTIKLRPGAYTGGVVVTKTLTIQGAGRGTLLKPVDTANGCTALIETAAGICAVGTPGAPVERVVVEDLTVRGFDGFGVVGFGTDRMRVTGVAAQDNTEYGITVFESTRSALIGNWITGSTEEAGLYVGDIADAEGTVVEHNYSAGNALGMLVRHARNVNVTDNIFVGNCTGIALVDDGQPGGQGNTSVTRNVVNHNNVNCPPFEQVPPLQGTGIAFIGGDHNVVSHNVVNGNRGDQPFSGGIVLVPGIPPDPSVAARPAEYNVISYNVVRHNAPFDLIDTSGSRTNTFTNNNCGTSEPDGLCAGPHH